MPEGRRTPAFPTDRGPGALPVSLSILSCIPWMFAGSPGLPIPGCWACLHKGVFFRGKAHYPPSFLLFVEAEGAGNFTRARSHRQPNPASPGSPGMRGMAPAWLWLQILVSDPARAHLSRGHAARLGRGLTPGSMKTRVVHCSRIPTPHSPSPSIPYNPNPLRAFLGACSMK